MTRLKILPMWVVSPQNVPQIEQKNDPQAGKTARIQILKKTFRITKSGLSMHDISGTLCQIVVQIGPHSSEISFFIWESFCYFPIIVNLKLYNFYTVQDRGIQSVYEMLRMKRAF